MSEQSTQQLTGTAAAFAAHVRAFHRSLSSEEQELLEQIFVLAERGAAGAGEEVAGYHHAPPGIPAAWDLVKNSQLLSLIPLLRQIAFPSPDQ